MADAASHTVPSDIVACDGKPSVFPQLREMFNQNRGLMAGAIGGPLAVTLLTPQRNAMTLSAKETSLSFVGIYRQVFAEGFLRGFRGGSRPAVMAIPQFTAVGPVFLEFERQTQSTSFAMVASSTIESLMSYSAQRRNAQIQFNAAHPANKQLAISPMYKIVGPGFAAHVGRNVLAMLGIRLLSPHSREIVRATPGASILTEQGVHVAADFISSVFSAVVSMPFNQAFSWAACTPELERTPLLKRGTTCVSALVAEYRHRGFKLLRRDLAIRISYTGFLFTIYRFVERNLVD